MLVTFKTKLGTFVEDLDDYPALKAIWTDKKFPPVPRLTREDAIAMDENITDSPGHFDWDVILGDRAHG